MVAVIKTGHSVQSIFRYNENKVKQGAAQCIGEGNYPAALKDLTFDMKLNRLLHQNALNGNVKRNSVHISLNFHPSENYSAEKLMKIADAYMEKIGFTEQPYLVYQHHDAGHPHIHLVSIKVREDGSRIDMQNIGKNQSEKARKEIEKQFNLMRAEGRKSEDMPLINPVAVSRVSYGKRESKKDMSAVLNSVLLNYKYTSLAELNAVLELYNIKADRGREDSRIFKTGGLVYRMLDREGKTAGVPIKASHFAMKPTLAFLEGRYALNSVENAFEKKRIRSAVDAVFLSRNMDMEKLAAALHKEGIDAVMRNSGQGQLYGITYVDHVTKCVLNGSALGKNYSAKGMLERCGEGAGSKVKAGAETLLEKEHKEQGETTFEETARGISDGISDGFFTNGLQELFKTEWQPDNVPAALKRKRRRRKKMGGSDLN
ncbi:relaxase/mobilization nuclease domain-containing protein [Flavobacterium tistrianum]|uniref:relaxase/mobilization nuclease domain-containing protein n=1 Tax=Flavobacterium tistrianum TaxID=1685414 RepID=UPI000DAD1F67|nr:relaxase/mobilization nuclease domain-containing protein [Flavobacterium tistrianum]KAF2340398.1 relaxase/mobilization nuclease domain-containing protein [Flavobacterium tistrianum]